MKSFSNYLKDYLKNRQLSIGKAAKICGIDRTTLGRCVNGNRIPSIEILSKLEKGLQMSDGDKNALYEAYQRTKISEEYHIDYALLETILQGRFIDSKSKGNIGEIENNDIKTESFSHKLDERTEVFKAIRYLLKDAEFIKMKFTPCCLNEDEEFKNIIWSLNGIAKLEQILSLDSIDWQYAEEKIRNLLYVLPILFQNESFRVYYYEESENKNKEIIEDNYIITDKGIVFFYRQFTHGFFSNQKVPCTYYANIFDRTKAKCRIFAEGGKETFLLSNEQKMDEIYENKETDIQFRGEKRNRCIWMINKVCERAVCIKENGCIKLLWKFIWNKEEI
ncbi:MAG: helix-turn-helix transcriptional regulator [Lachnospiraceae bacterium]|nr:helix-turn-helix transcriptional regulator [Lachnospiraceae bacterium]